MIRFHCSALAFINTLIWNVRLLYSKDNLQHAQNNSTECLLGFLRHEFLGQMHQVLIWDDFTVSGTLRSFRNAVQPRLQANLVKLCY